MVSPAAGQRAHSARVEIELILDAGPRPQIVSVAQVGRGFLIAADPVESLPGHAQLVMRVDGRERRRSVFLPDGIGPASKTVRIEKAG